MQMLKSINPMNIEVKKLAFEKETTTVFTQELMEDVVGEMAV